MLKEEMKFSCAIFFFVLIIGAQFQRTQTALNDDLVHFKQTLDDASEALENIEDTPAINGNADLQRQRRRSIDDLINNSEYDLNLNLERETLDMENDLMHPLEGRAIKNENRNNNDEYNAKKTNVNDQLNELVRANSRFQNLHRQLLNSFHNSNRNLKFDAELQKSRGNSQSSNSRNKDTFLDKENKENKDDKLYKDKGNKGEEKEKNTNKGKDSNSYSNSNKNNKEKNFYNNFDYSNKDSRFYTNYNLKSNFGTKNAFNSGVDYTKDDAISSSNVPSFSNFNSMDSFKGNGRINNDRTNIGLNAGPALFRKAYINCRPLSSNTARTKPDTSILDITSGFHNPPQNREPNTNLNSYLLLEANTYRNAMQDQNAKDNALEELNEKKVDPEMRRMMEKIDFPHFRLDFDSSMEDYARSKSNTADDDEPISYEKTIENIHFPSIVNDQFDLGRNDLSHEADYKLSKIEQEQSEPRKGRTRSDGIAQNIKIPWKRSSGFNPMDEIKLKTSTRLMAKGLGPSLPSYALPEIQNAMHLDDAVKKLEQNFEAGSELGMRGYYRPSTLLSKDELDWLERLKNIEGEEERSVTRLIHEGEDDAPKEEKEVKKLADKEKSDNDLLLGPTYSVLRKRKIDDLAKYNDPKDDAPFDLEYLSRIRPEDILLMEVPSLPENNNALADEGPSPEASAGEEESAADARASNVIDNEIANDMEDAQEFDESEAEEEEAEMAEKSKRSINAKCSGVARDKREKEGVMQKEDAEQKETPILKQNTNTDVGSNVAKRRVKRIGVVNENEDKTGLKDNLTGGLMDRMAVIKLEPKREVGAATNAAPELEKRAGRAKRSANTVYKIKAVQKNTENVPLKQKLLRRRRREHIVNKEIHEDDSLHTRNGAERKRRSLNNKSKLRLRREAEKAKASAEKKDKEKADENVKERKKDKQNVSEKDTDKEDAKKTIRCEKINGNKTEDHLVGKRAARIVDDVDDNNSNNNRKIMDTALLLGERGNTLPASAYGEHALEEKSETLNDAAVIAADRRAMNAARAAYRRNTERLRAANGNARDDSYENLMERLRRLSIRKSGRERERERDRLRDRERDRENDLGSSVNEFGDEVFDNLKQSDQNARHFDGLPIDNLWYGNDPWEDDNSNDNSQQKGNQRNDEDMNKNQPNEQRSALTIKIEDGAIKSVERKDEPKKSSKSGLINPRESNEEDDDYNNSDDTPFGWFSKNKANSNNTNSKTDENGLVLKVNDQLLNCTAFNTLESFLKSVKQQEQPNRSDDSSRVSVGNDNSISKGGSGNCEGQDHFGTGRSSSEGKENERQGNEKKGIGNYGYGIPGGSMQSGGMQGGGGQRGSNQGAGNQVGGGQKPGAMGVMGCSSSGGDGQGMKTAGSGDRGGQGGGGAGRKTEDTGKKVGSDNSGGGADSFGIGGSGNGLGPPGAKCSSKGSDASGQKRMKLNITINASVMGDQKAKNFVGNGTIKVQSEDRERRGITFPQFEEFKRIATKRKCPKPKMSCDESVANSKGATEIVKSMFNMARCNPQMKPLWSSLKRNQQCLKKSPPPEGGFEKMQKDDINRIEEMVEQAMEAISNIIDDQVQQRSCVPLPPELKLLYENILEIYESNSAEGVREKRASLDESPFNEFAKEVRLIDPNSVEERSRIVKKLLRQYDDLPVEDQQQIIGLREDLQDNLNFLESFKGEQNQKKREQIPQSAQLQQSNKEQQQTDQAESLQLEQEQQEVPQVHQEPNNEGDDSAADEQTRWQRELVKRLEAEKEDDKEVVKAYNLPYTPEFLRLLKATELMEEKEIKEAEGIAED